MQGRLGRIAGIGAIAALAAGAVILVVAALPDGVADTANSDPAAAPTTSTSTLVASAATTADQASGTAVSVPGLVTTTPAAAAADSAAAAEAAVDSTTPMTDGTSTGTAPPTTNPAAPGSDVIPAAPALPATPDAPAVPEPPAAPSSPKPPAPPATAPPSAATAPALPTAPSIPAPTTTAPATTKPATPKTTAPKTTAPKTTAPKTTPAPSTTSRAATPNAGIPMTLGNATQVITVAAASRGATTATLHAWQRQADGTWRDMFGAVKAYVGAAGIGQASESVSRTPQGTFPLTEAFGALADPGTALPYRVTGPNDWWVSDTTAASYNTWQTCAKAQCSFKTSVSEHLQSIRPYYDYAVVMDVNRSPVVAGAGSAFFLHVSVGQPTAGCVAIDKATLVQILRWLDPAQHPRIATGIA